MMDGLLPRDSVPVAALLPDHGLRYAVGSIDEIIGIAAFHAQVTVIDRRIQCRSDLNDPVVANTHVEFAAGAAVRTCAACPCFGSAVLDNRLVLQRSGWA